GNGSHASTLKSPSYTKSVSWQHYQFHFALKWKVRSNCAIVLTN
ncbi:transposase, partial [Escherichia coli]|nr:transposase [Shigella flexneri]EGE3298784.1 transposase [Shigella flexneri]EHF0902908.1 transposase [Shigella flexneri]EHF3759163.1 transposase [Escherichia coli]